MIFVGNNEMNEMAWYSGKKMQKEKNVEKNVWSALLCFALLCSARAVYSREIGRSVLVVWLWLLADLFTVFWYKFYKFSNTLRRLASYYN